MNGTKNTEAGNIRIVSNRIPRPFDQADIDGEPVETVISERLFFSAVDRADGSVPMAEPSAVPKHCIPIPQADITYGDVSGSSFGDDSERERDA